jgi:hypothetical protein
VPRLPAVMPLPKKYMKSSPSSGNVRFPVSRASMGTLRSHAPASKASSCAMRRPRSLKRWPLLFSLGNPSWQKWQATP